MPEVHAKLSASGAKRWLNCPKSVALESLFPDTSSEYAKEGTDAHEAAEMLLNYIIKGEKQHLDSYSRLLRETNQEMSSNVWEYVNFCLDKYHEALLRTGSVSIFIEERLDYSQYVPGGFGTGDCVIIYGNKLIINDLKYGKGVPVSAENNPQLRLYALGALDGYGWIYDIEEIEMNIIQPRLKSIETERITAKELIEWAKTEVVDRARMANANEGAYNPGADQCKFCKARALCKARAYNAISTIQSILDK